MTPREKVYRDALEEIAANEFMLMAHAKARTALSAADAIPDAPKCQNCGPLGNDFCTWAGHRAIPDAMVSDAILCMCGSCAYCLERTRIAIPDAPVAEPECNYVGDKCNSTRCPKHHRPLRWPPGGFLLDEKDRYKAPQAQPVPSRAELIELIVRQWNRFPADVHDNEAAARVLDALIKAVAVR